MQSVQRSILMVAGLLLIGFSLFPPWNGGVIYDTIHPHPIATEFVGWRFVLSQPRHMEVNGAYSEISSGILMVQVVLLAGLTTVAIALTSSNNAASRQ